MAGSPAVATAVVAGSPAVSTAGMAVSPAVIQLLWQVFLL